MRLNKQVNHNDLNHQHITMFDLKHVQVLIRACIIICISYVQVLILKINLSHMILLI